MTTAEAVHCAGCGRALPGRSGFTLAGRRRCARCTLLRTQLLLRSLLTALVVGSIVTTINQGDRIVSGGVHGDLYWKIPMTYCVPFCVATWGALINSRPVLADSATESPVIGSGTQGGIHG